MPLDITIPTTQTSSTQPPHTLYTIHLRSPLRTTILHKRYTDFCNLHAALTSQAGAAPPASLPAKSWFTRTVTSPALTESRRRGLEAYLRAVETAPDTRWRDGAAWRDFLGAQAAEWTGTDAERQRRKNVAAAKGGAGGDGAAIEDGARWLEVHRELKTQLHGARTALTRRERATVASAQHEASMDAKKCLIKTGGLIRKLEDGLDALGGGGNKDGAAGGWGGREKLGEGEIRRRKDLISAARKEREGLEAVLSSLAVRSAANGGGVDMGGMESAVATEGDKGGLFKTTQGGAGAGGGGGGRRVLGAPLKETDKTRELDNEGVLQLQKQIIAEQDQDAVDLTQVVRRMREMGVQINEEVVLQNEMMGMLDRDVDRVGSKIEVAKKRIGKIK